MTKILRLCSYFFPENLAASHLMNDLFEAFQKAEIETEVYCPTPTRGIDNETRKKYKHIKYEEMYDGTVKVHRFSMFREGKNPFLRAIRYILCNIIQYFKGCRAQNIDLILGTSTPPTQGMLCALVKKKLKVPFIYNLQDIFPDSLVNAGFTKKGSLLWKIGRKIEDFTYRNADKIIVISDGLKKNIMEKGVPEEKIEVIPNWVDTNDVHPIPRQMNPLISELNIDPTKFIVLYAGNFGRAQGADIVIKAAEQLIGNDQIQFVIFGGGSEFQDAIDYVKEKKLTNIIIRPLLPPERVSEVYSLGDIAIITCKKGFGSSCVPSKTWSIMACETPILASFDLNSELAEILHDSGAGYCIEPENVNELSEAIMYSYQIWTQGMFKENIIREYVLKNASKDICIKKYMDTLLNF